MREQSKRKRRKPLSQQEQMAILTDTTVHLTAEGFDDFLAHLDRPPGPPSRKMRERLSRKAPWERS